MNHKLSESIDQLLNVLTRMRDEHKGCLWIRKQTWHSLVSHTIEEAYELAHAIEQEQNSESIKDELADLLYQIVFYAHIAEESGWFDLTDIVQVLTRKLIDRHPDVFKDKTAHNNQYHNQWERIKYAEKRQKSRLYQGDSCSFSLLSDIAQNLPALSMAGKLQKRAACVGFDWHFSKEVFDQLVSEVREVEKAMAEKDPSNVLEEIGDVMFCCVSLIRHYEADPEKIMRQANNKFKRRFEAMEREADKRQQSLADMDKDTLENLWALAKK